MKTGRRMDLTQDMVALVHRQVDDGGPLPGMDCQTDEDYRAMATKLLSSHTNGEDAWLFAYGSLIWKPECEYAEERCGTAQGWHRAFCFRVWRFRGTRECPGLMMALDRGGQCKGVLLRLPAASLREQVEKLCRREITVKPPNTSPRWVTVVSDGMPVRAIAFVMNRDARAYVGKLTPEETAEVLVKACGHWGSGAEYLFNTVCKLEGRGIHDRYLWRLQRLVAERIAAGAGRRHD